MTMENLNALECPLEGLWLAMNSATVTILQGRYSDALETLTEVFQNEAVLEAWKNRNTTEPHDDGNSSQPSSTSTSSKECRFLSVTPLPALPIRQSDGSFLNPFSIDQHGIIFHNGNKRRQVLLGMCAVSLFNMAITYHSMALTSLEDTKQSSRQATCQKLLYQARVLYLQSNLLFKRVKKTLDPHETLTNVYLAICNNMIVVESHLGNSHEAWREELSQSFCLIPPRVECPVYQHFEEVLSYYLRTGA